MSLSGPTGGPTSGARNATANRNAHVSSRGDALGSCHTRRSMAAYAIPAAAAQLKNAGEPSGACVIASTIVDAKKTAPVIASAAETDFIGWADWIINDLTHASSDIAHHCRHPCGRDAGVCARAGAWLAGRGTGAPAGRKSSQFDLVPSAVDRAPVGGY